MALTREETLAKLAEQEEKIAELQTTLAERPERLVVQVNEVVIENSSQGGDIGALAGALAIAQGQFTSVVKGASGHGYDYANLEFGTSCNYANHIKAWIINSPNECIQDAR